MTNEVACEWSIDGVLNEITNIHTKMKDRQFAFILGAGASFKSGIPTGHQLAQQWIKEIHQRECLDEESIEKWMETCGIGEGRLTLNSAAEHYPQIFERRFDGDREAGYAELEAAMEGKSPSLGYSLLAEIIQKTRNKVVVTTNFDNLVADALAMHAHQSPLVVAHESLAGFVRPQLRRPLVAKIHRDLFLQPINDVNGVSKLETSWTLALKKLFQHFTPIVIGYGGNDGSLMNMLESLNYGDISGRMFWCYRNRSAIPEKVLSVLKKHKGILVKIEGFDEFMLQLSAKLIDNFNVTDIAERTAKLGEQRADHYRAQTAELQKSLMRGTPDKQRVGAVIQKSIETNNNWWAWVLKAQNAATPHHSDQIYRDGISHLPESSALIGSYALFLASRPNQYDAAEAMFKKAIDLDPNRSMNIGNYANFLKMHRKDDNSAKKMYKKAIELDPNDADHIGNYALFLTKDRKDHDEAEALYKKALELDPRHGNNTANYANFLAEKRHEYDSADVMYKKALELNPNDANIIGNYANFLSDARKDYDAAEAMYKKALELDPSNAIHTGNYASFQAVQRKDYDKADELYKKMLELDPSDPTHIGGYATLLAHNHNNYDAAEAMYKKALELDSNNDNNYANLASLLLTKGDDDSLNAVPTLVQRAVKLSSQDLSQTLAESLLYGALVNKLKPDSQLSSMLSYLKWVLEKNFPRKYWDFTPIFNIILPRLSDDDRNLFKAIGDAILNEDQVSKLEAIDTWRDIKSISPFVK